MSNSDVRESNEVFTANKASAAGFQTRNVMQEDFGYEVPVESVPLPSRGVVYSTDSPLYGKETVDIRAMTAREEDILTSRALIKKGTVITHLIKSCLCFHVMWFKSWNNYQLVCEAKGLRQCNQYKQVMKSKCSKKMCK